MARAGDRRGSREEAQEEEDEVEAVMRYHATSSHHDPTRMARGGTMDWNQQPAKCLRFHGRPMLDLEDFSRRSAEDRPTPSLSNGAVHPTLLRLFEHDPTPSAPSAGSASQGEDAHRSERGCEAMWLARVLQDAFGLTAWKGNGAALWALRANASSGALQPCEAYVLGDASAVAQWSGVGAALFHYNPFWHALEVLCELPDTLWADVRRQLPLGSALVAVTAIYWRNAWKYGDPGVRYVHQDLGHHLGALGFACASGGARVALLEGVSDDDIARLVGLEPPVGRGGSSGAAGTTADDEQPQILVAIAPPGAGSIDARNFVVPSALSVPFRNRAGCATRTGSKLSSINVDGHWACRKTRPTPQSSTLWSQGPVIQPSMPFGFASRLRRCIAARRSAHELDPSRTLPFAHLLDVLRATLPRAAPFDMLPFSRPLVPLVLVFVHRVDGLAPGLYGLCRDEGRLAWLQACAPRYRWRQVQAARDAGVPLFELHAPEDLRNTAKVLSCQQQIAGTGCAALAMLIEYEPLLRTFGPWMYRRAHWEAGMVGQALYLAAEDVGCGSTAMGCFFGPWTHDTLGIDARQLQDVEHFILGYPIEDVRVQTIAPYAHLARFRQLEDRDAVNTGSEDKAIVELSQTSFGRCLACGRAHVEGRLGTDEYAGQFFCGRCWAAWDPRLQRAEAEDEERVAASEIGPVTFVAAAASATVKPVSEAALELAAKLKLGAEVAGAPLHGCPEAAPAPVVEPELEEEAAHVCASDTAHRMATPFAQTRFLAVDEFEVVD